MGVGEDINPGTVGLGLLEFFESLCSIKKYFRISPVLLSFCVCDIAERAGLFFFSLFVDRNI